MILFIHKYFLTNENLRTFTGKKELENICTTRTVSVQIVEMFDAYFPCALI